MPTQRSTQTKFVFTHTLRSLTL